VEDTEKHEKKSETWTRKRAGDASKKRSRNVDTEWKEKTNGLDTKNFNDRNFY
jgi:hypothetical protein